MMYCTAAAASLRRVFRPNKHVGYSIQYNWGSWVRVRVRVCVPPPCCISSYALFIHLSRRRSRLQHNTYLPHRTVVSCLNSTSTHPNRRGLYALCSPVLATAVQHYLLCQAGSTMSQQRGGTYFWLLTVFGRSPCTPAGILHNLRSAQASILAMRFSLA